MPRCECRCGYTCGRQCGLELSGPDGCLARHFQEDCHHQWDGQEASESDDRGLCWVSTTCSKCGAVKMFHDMAVGP